MLSICTRATSTSSSREHIRGKLKPIVFSPSFSEILWICYFRLKPNPGMSVLTRGSKKGNNQVIQKWLLQIISSLMIVNFSGLVKLYLKLWVHKRILTTGENCLQIERQSLFAFLFFKTVLHSFEKPTLWQPSDVQNHVIQGETKVVVTLNWLFVQEIEWQCSRSLTSLIPTWRPCHNVSLF